MSEQVRPEHHKIIEEKIVYKRGRTGTAFKLKWNPQLAEQAACKGLDTELFFPDQEVFTPDEEQVFVSLCIECPVMLMCLEWGLAHERSGVWGGTTPYRRLNERKRRGWVVSEPASMLK